MDLLSYVENLLTWVNVRLSCAGFITDWQPVRGFCMALTNIRCKSY